jgi:hypothetical protein
MFAVRFNVNATATESNVKLLKLTLPTSGTNFSIEINIEEYAQEGLFKVGGLIIYNGASHHSFNYDDGTATSLPVTVNYVAVGPVEEAPVTRIEAVIARETFGNTGYDTNNPTPQESGWGSGTAWHWNWTDVTTFTSGNGYIASGSDSSIRINNYISGGAVQGWEGASGNMGVFLSKPDAYSGSWDTLTYNDINIVDAHNLSVSFGFLKRDHASTVADIIGINVEARINKGDWIQLDTTIIPNPLAAATWAWVEMPIAGKGDVLDIRISSNLNQSFIDDITIKGMVPAPDGVNDFVVENVVVGAVDSPEDFTCNLNMIWDETNVYVNFVIVDDSIVATGTVYQIDNIEVYFDMDNSKNIHWPRNGGWVSNDPTYDSTDFQLRLVPEQEFSANNSLANVVQVYERTDVGYNFSLTIPWESLMPGFVPEIGSQIGFDVLVSDNDAIASDANRNQITLFSKTDKPFNDPSLFGTLQFETMGSFQVIPDVELPTRVTALVAAVDKYSVTLTWENGTDNIAVLYYNVYQNGELLPNKVYPKETGNSLKINNLAPGNYNFAFETVDNSGNVSELKNTVYNILITEVGVAEISKAKLFVYPNPATSEITIKGVNNISKVEVIGMTGNVVKYFVGSQVIDVRELSKGSYILKVHAEKDVQITRFVKN